MARKLSSQLTGVSGEYFVAAELSQRGLVASISLRNTRGIDLLVTDQDANKSITIQCKTNQTGRRTWVLGKSCEEFYSPSHFYIFVALGNIGERPLYHIVPSTDLARIVRSGHQKWLRTPGKNGQPHKDSSVRNFSDAKGEYFERWDLLGCDVLS